MNKSERRMRQVRRGLLQAGPEFRALRSAFDVTIFDRIAAFVV